MRSINLYIKFLACAIIVSMCYSCGNDFLDINPKGKLIAKSASDYDLALSNFDFLTLNFSATLPQVAMGDEVAAIEPYFSGAELHDQRFFRWDDNIYQSDEDAVELDITMRNIYAYNKIINEVMEASGGTEQKKKSIRAEALAGRAWTYFLLINYYGKPYKKGEAASDPGFPIVTEADATATDFTRSSVEEVYQFIIKDLTTAIPDLPAEISYRMRMSKPAANGLLGKVYTYMGEFDQALPLLDEAISGLSASSIPVGLYNYNETFGSGGEFTPPGLFGPPYPTLTRNIENIYAKQFVNNSAFTDNQFVLRPEAAALYDTSDLRLNFFSGAAFFGSAFPEGMLRRIGPTTTQFGIVVPDLYLLKAECEARLNDLANAVSDVETLRKNRMPESDAAVPQNISNDQKSLVKFILQERTREFALEGFRWFTMRRLSVDPDYNGLVNDEHILYDADGNIIETYTLDPNRFVLRFSQKLMEQNPNMEQNP